MIQGAIGAGPDGHLGAVRVAQVIRVSDLRGRYLYDVLDGHGGRFHHCEAVSALGGVSFDPLTPDVIGATVLIAFGDGRSPRPWVLGRVVTDRELARRLDGSSDTGTGGAFPGAAGAGDFFLERNGAVFALTAAGDAALVGRSVKLGAVGGVILLEDLRRDSRGLLVSATAEREAILLGGATLNWLAAEVLARLNQIGALAALGPALAAAGAAPAGNKGAAFLAALESVGPVAPGAALPYTDAVLTPEGAAALLSGLVEISAKSRAGL